MDVVLPYAFPRHRGAAHRLPTTPLPPLLPTLHACYWRCASRCSAASRRYRLTLHFAACVYSRALASVWVVPPLIALPPAVGYHTLAHISLGFPASPPLRVLALYFHLRCRVCVRSCVRRTLQHHRFQRHLFTTAIPSARCRIRLYLRPHPAGRVVYERPFSYHAARVLTAASFHPHLPACRCCIFSAPVLRYTARTRAMRTPHLLLLPLRALNYVLPHCTLPFLTHCRAYLTYRCLPAWFGCRTCLPHLSPFSTHHMLYLPPAPHLFQTHTHLPTTRLYQRPCLPACRPTPRTTLLATSYLPAAAAPAALRTPRTFCCHWCTCWTPRIPAHYTASAVLLPYVHTCFARILSSPFTTTTYHTHALRTTTTAAPHLTTTDASTLPTYLPSPFYVHTSHCLHALPPPPLPAAALLYHAYCHRSYLPHTPHAFLLPTAACRWVTHSHFATARAHCLQCRMCGVILTTRR